MFSAGTDVPWEPQHVRTNRMAIKFKHQRGCHEHTAHVYRNIHMCDTFEYSTKQKLYLIHYEALLDPIELCLNVKMQEHTAKKAPLQTATHRDLYPADPSEEGGLGGRGHGMAVAHPNLEEEDLWGLDA